MAVKQNVSECVDATPEARLQLIMRVLNNICTQEGLPDKVCSQIVSSLGTIQIPKDVKLFKKFIDCIECVQSDLAKECSNRDLVFGTLKALYDEISDPNKQPSPVMSIVLQLLEPERIPPAVDYILNISYPEQKLERTLYTLCSWLSKWTYTNNLGPLILAFMQGLEAEHHYDILVDVTLATIEQLFRLLVLPHNKDKLNAVVMHMLSRVQHTPEAFHKIIPHIGDVVTLLDKERSDFSLSCLQDIVSLSFALMEHFPDYPKLYEPVKAILQPYFPATNYQQLLNCKSWSDGGVSIVPSRCSVGKVGLNNLGNTCYMNSVLQALFMTKTFRNEVLLFNKSMQPLLSNLQVLFALLQHSKRYALSPSDILNLSRPHGFQPGYQHDSSEFMGYLLDTLHEQENLLGGGAVEPMEVEDSASASSCLQTVVQQSFGGKTMTISRCDECGRKSERADNFRELQLSFPNTSDKQSVQNLLDYYMQPEKLTGDNKYHCDICNRLTDGERITKIVEEPARLILTLKHFRYDPSSHQRTKLLQNVKLDEHVQLEDAQYELYAAVVHCGSSVDSGHYYTFAKDDQDWYKFNDCSVIKTTFEDLCKLRPPETPYILFYGRIDFKEPENLPCTVLSSKLQSVLTKHHSEYDMKRRRATNKVYNTRRNQRNDEPPPPGCGGGGFSNATGNMFVC